MARRMIEVFECEICSTTVGGVSELKVLEWSFRRNGTGRWAATRRIEVCLDCWVQHVAHYYDWMRSMGTKLPQEEGE
jgi:hypothetical protein